MSTTYYVTRYEGNGQPGKTWAVPEDVNPRKYARELADDGFVGGYVCLYATNPADDPSDAVEVYTRRA